MKNKTALMILGADLYTEPAIASLKEAGFKLVIVDGNRNAPGFKHASAKGAFSFREIQKAIKLAKTENVKAVIPTHDRAVFPAAQISQALGLKGNSISAAQAATSKEEMRKAWKLHGKLPSPEVKVANSLQSFIKAVKEIGYPAICKANGDVGGGSRGVMKIDAETDLEKAFAFASSFDEKGAAIVEPFFEGKEHSVEILAKDGKGTVLTISDKVQTDPPYRVGKTLIYPSSADPATVEKIKAIAIDSALALGLVTGAAHVELVSMDNGEIILFEAALRCGGGVIPHPISTAVTGVNQIVEYANILTDGSAEISNPKGLQHACWHFITAPPGKISGISGFEEASIQEGVISSGLVVKPGDTIEPLRTSSQRLGYFVTVGRSGEEAYSRALNAESMVKFSYSR